MGWREYAPSPSPRIIGEGPESVLSKRERKWKRTRHDRYLGSRTQTPSPSAQPSHHGHGP